MKPSPPLNPFIRKALKKLIGKNTFRTILGRHEDTTKFIWQKLSKELDKQSAILDIGAYIGEFSILARMNNPHVHIHLFEPNVLNLKQLKKNIIGLNIEASNLAISNKSEKVLFSNQKAVSKIINNQTSDYPSFEVNTTTLDKYQKEKNIIIRLIKIDTEGNEFKILSGASNLLNNYSPIICCEVLTNKAGHKLTTLLKEKYVFYHVDEKYKKVLKETLVDRKLWRNKNWFFVPINKIDTFESIIREL